MLFERFYKDQPPRKYFACSVYRDRKQCSFFMWADAKVTDDRRKRWKQVFEANQPKISHKDLMRKLETCKKLNDQSNLKYCTLCSILVLPNELNDHKTHGDVCTISFCDIFHPSKFIPAITSRKGEAVRMYYSIYVIISSSMENLCVLQVYVFSVKYNCVVLIIN